MDAGTNFELDATVRNILQKRSLKWIFVGGKGGVGKTTCSCSVAIQLAKVRENVLIISTDPAHNLSDAFAQKFTKNPTRVEGFSNLYAMEIDPNISEEDLADGPLPEGVDPLQIQELMLAIPGIDEAMSFAEMMKQVQSMQFSCIVFDTAPTGHTLRLLSFPSTLQKGLGKLFSLKNKFAGLFGQLSGMFGLPGGFGSEEQIMGKLEQTRAIIDEVNAQFKNPDLTTFMPVCIPEFLSLYETERLIQELVKFEIDTQDIIVNQLLYPESGSNCGLCLAREKMQQKYLSQIGILYGLDFHVIKLPMLKNEIRGSESLIFFSQFLVDPFDPNNPQHRILPAAATH